MTRGAALLLTAVLASAPATAAAAAQATAPPDPTAMSGVPLSVPEMTAGTVTVRVVRGALTSPVANQAVDLVDVSGKRTTVKTDAQGRAQFGRLAPQAQVRAQATVDGQLLTSQAFAVPAQGGTRLLLVAQIGAAAAPPAATAPAMPLLSTTATPSSQAPIPAEMAGHPLQVGDLRPGTVVVRLVRVSFANNLAARPVDLRVDNQGPPLRKVTNPDGRAEFAGLRVGAEVQAFADVDGERLESQRFTLPGDGGVRLVLVARTGSGGAPLATGASPDGSAPAPGRWSALIELLATLGVVAGVGGGLTWTFFRAKRTAGDRRAVTAGRSLAKTSRDEMFEALVALEERMEAGELSEASYRVERERLMISLESLSPQS